MNCEGKENHNRHDKDFHSKNAKLGKHNLKPSSLYDSITIINDYNSCPSFKKSNALKWDDEDLLNNTNTKERNDMDFNQKDKSDL
ncbi:hypothetical protein IRZ83_13470 [Flavobacterium sp. JLP]|uniref:hypothetical protein n=1 Tax=unclassified Flavobacterium TaxID=196869 RepID=UPI001889E6C8|nr:MULTISPECIES: hypothetical protein [unclassified Flavobacterium]MBF4494223.1 hypothetical protein [Flavobacterium sp. MR2016-29]MBF4507680.1 hypothetical protein [Flavobacterium sp. JLP]